jgi:hypothetical protein
MDAETDAAVVLRESARRLQRLAGVITDAEVAAKVRLLALDCDHDAAELERFVLDTRLRPANDHP